MPIVYELNGKIIERCLYDYDDYTDICTECGKVATDTCNVCQEGLCSKCYTSLRGVCSDCRKPSTQSSFIQED